MSCHHPSMWRFLEKLKKEQALVEVKQAFYISGKKPGKRRCYSERESALENLIKGYLTRPKDEFLRGVAYHLSKRNALVLPKTTFSKLNIYNSLGSFTSLIYHLSNSCGSESLSVLAQNYVNIF